MHDTPLIHNVPIVSEKGLVRGHIKITVQAILGKPARRPTGLTTVLLICPLPLEDNEDIKSTSKVLKQSNYARVQFEDSTYSRQCVAEGGDESSSASSESLMVIADNVSRLDSINEDLLPAYLKIGKEFTFRIIILEVAGISTEYSDIFCQFKFMHRSNEAFSTEPIPNTGMGPPLGFFHIHYFTVTVTRSFVDYMQTQPLLFEVLGHYNHHPLHSQATVNTSPST
jgi:kinesin family protein 1